MKYRPTQGFTLIELAIVLVIIGLLVGGVLVGRDLIKAAELNASTAQLGKFNSAATTFLLKYGGLPGDLVAVQATNLGFITRPGTYDYGDGNGIVGTGTSSNPGRLCCENVLFWSDLSTAQLIANTFTGDGVLANFVNFATSSDFVPYVPHLRMRNNTFVHVVPYNNQNHYMLMKMNTTSVIGTIGSAAGLSSSESWQIDTKLDDGMPASGNVLAVASIGASGPTLATPTPVNGNACSVNTTPNSYNTTNPSFGDNINCRLIIRTNF